MEPVSYPCRMSDFDTRLVPVQFSPDYAEEAAAAVVARALFLRTIDDRSVIDGSGDVAEALAAYRDRGLRVRPALLLTWLSMRAEGMDNVGGADELVDFEARFAAVGPSLALGALLAEGTGAQAPAADAVIDGVDEAVSALVWGDGVELSLENMAVAFSTAPPSLHQAAVCLTGPPTKDAAAVLYDRALDHGQWCVEGYLRTRATPEV